jgi:activator of HSP90 ATPase
MALKTKKLHQTVIIKATPEQVYETLMDSDKHSELTGSKAVMSPEVGGVFSAYDGYITGKNVALVKAEKIVQEWRGEEEGWPEKHFSKITFVLKPIKGGTQIDFTQEGLPEPAFEDIKEGWEDYYWRPLKEKFGELK